MCGRFVIAMNPEQLALEFGLQSAPDFPANYNVAPTQPVAVITNDAPGRVEVMNWGLIPSWSKDPAMGSKLFNARSETIDEKPSFRSAFKRRRCLIPANGFYEWKTLPGGKKAPHFIHLPERPVFAFAGLWEVWQNPEGDVRRTCTVLTTEANPFMKALHERMPVILEREDYATWLVPGDAAAGMLKPLLRSYDSAKMAAYEVSTRVNRAGVSDPGLIDPVEQGRLF